MDNRISQVSVGVTMDRATSKNEFGQMLARGLATGSNMVGGVAGSILPGGAVISAAINQTAGRALSRGGGASAGIGGGGMPGTSGSTTSNSYSNGGADDAAGLQSQLGEDRVSNLQFLDLQRQMQRESQQFNAVTNIMKVRHESSKAAINNVR